jgi:hypothetical protein
MHGVKWYPAMWLSGLTAVLGLVVAFGFLTQSAASYAATVGTAVIGLVTVALTKPFDVPLMGTLISTILVGVGGFGIHLSDAKIGAVVTVVTLIAGYLTHQNATPKAGSPAKLDPGLTALRPAA